MSLVGKTVSRYKVTRRLGTGGMGEVYLAEDASLRRSVALKVLHPAAFRDKDISRRFQREAQAAAGLSHPNIITTYEIGTHEGSPFIAMEYVEGKSLAARIRTREWTVREALQLAMQLLGGLEHAHRAGIIHRDIKPENLLVGDDGRLRILDFGLAHIAEASRITESGATVGTLAYMSPEQTRGETVDARSDIFAAGCVLYEMVTRQPAFQGEHRAAILYSIANEAPQPMARYRRDVSPGLERIVSRALAKDPALRYQSAADMRSELAALVSEPSVVVAQGAGAPRARARWPAHVIVAVAAVAVTALVMSWLPRGASNTKHPPVERFILGAAPLTERCAPAISADGRTVYYAEEVVGARRILRRPIGSFEADPVAGTEGGSLPFLSPDGTWLGFITPDAIRKVPLEGGAPQTIASVPHATSAEWAPDGSILYTVQGGGPDGKCGIGRVPAAGAPLEVVVPLDSAGAGSCLVPEILPDGKSFLFSSTSETQPNIDAVMDGGRRHTVVEGGFGARYAATGHLLWLDWDSRAVLAAPFDPSTARITGAAFPLTGEVDIWRCFDSSQEGTIVFVPEPGSGESDVVWVDRTGVSTPIIEIQGTWRQPRLSPDGRQLVLRKSGLACELWLIDLVRGGMTRITPGGDNHNPVWSPDGSRIAFRTTSATDASLVALDIAGSRSSEVLLADAVRILPHSWSADGRTLACSYGDRAIELLSVAGGDRARVPWAPGGGARTNPAFSPDGRWIAYESTESGRTEVLMRAYADPRKVHAVSTAGGESPLWSRDGRELFFVSERKLWSVSMTSTPKLRIGLPVELFGGHYTWNHPGDYDVSLDGRRFVMIRQSLQTGDMRELWVVQNWPEEVERLRVHDGAAK